MPENPRRPGSSAERATPRFRSASLERWQNVLPDVRDGLNRLDRIILWQHGVLEAERRGRPVPSAMLYGRVVEHITISPQEFQDALARLVGRTR